MADGYMYRPVLYLFWQEGRLIFLYWVGPGHYGRFYCWDHDVIFCLNRDRSTKPAEDPCVEFLGWYEHWAQLTRDAEVVLSSTELARLLLSFFFWPREALSRFLSGKKEVR